MRVSWTDTNGRKVVIAHVHEIRESWDNKIKFEAELNCKPMRIFIDGEEFIDGLSFEEFCSFIDTEIVLSADKEE